MGRFGKLSKAAIGASLGRPVRSRHGDIVLSFEDGLVGNFAILQSGNGSCACRPEADSGGGARRGVESAGAAGSRAGVRRVGSMGGCFGVFLASLIARLLLNRDERPIDSADVSSPLGVCRNERFSPTLTTRYFGWFVGLSQQMVVEVLSPTDS